MPELSLTPDAVESFRPSIDDPACHDIGLNSVSEHLRGSEMMGAGLYLSPNQLMIQSRSFTLCWLALCEGEQKAYAELSGVEYQRLSVAHANKYNRTRIVRTFIV